MLVLSRKLGESIIIEGNIKITVVDIDRGKIRLGVEAPRNKTVHREEVHLAIERSKQQQPATSAR